MITTATLVAALVVAAVAAARGTWSPCGLSMISAINPMTERARGHRYAVTCAWFVAGSLAGGVALGGLGALGAALVGLALPADGSGTGGAHVVAGLVAVAAVVCLASDARVGVRLPGHPRQVNETWLSTYRRWIYAAGFGAQIGFGFATYIMTAATYLVVALMAATGSVQEALLVGAWFGLVRGAAVLLAGRARTPAALMSLHRGLERAAPASLLACAAVTALTAMGAGLVAAGAAGGAVAGLSVLGIAAVAVRRRLTSPAVVPALSTAAR